MSTYPRFWAGVGNIFRVIAALNFLAASLAFVVTVQQLESGSPGSNFTLEVVLVAITFMTAVLLWNAKGALVSGRHQVFRWLAGAWVVMWVVASLGLAMAFIGLAYATARVPVDWDAGSPWRTKSSPRVQQPKRPMNWSPTGQIGPSGASVYADVNRSETFGVLDSYVPVQVMQETAGFAFVIAASGASGWVDQRTLRE